MHIVHNGSLSPSSFIPFCEYGKDKSVVGENILHFDVPVCNKFKEIQYNGQICYEIDVNKLRNSNSLANNAELTFWMDYNFEKQTVEKKQRGHCYRDTGSFAEKYYQENICDKASIYIGTIGKCFSEILLEFLKSTFIQYL